MRINPLEDGKFRSSEVKKKKKIKFKSSSAVRNTDSTSFFEVLEEAEEEKLDELLERLIRQVVKSGNNLVRSPTQENFRSYRESIKDFLKVIEKKLYKIGKQLSSVDLHLIVQEVDNRLEKIAAELFEAERGAILLSARVQEIYGLLMDLYR
ncbi:YaaR family protein [Pseudothermotoga elfii]|nr:uncharacterized protein [Pseudothermotoga sp.]